MGFGKSKGFKVGKASREGQARSASRQPAHPTSAGQLLPIVNGQQLAQTARMMEDRGKSSLAAQKRKRKPPPVPGREVIALLVVLLVVLLIVLLIALLVVLLIALLVVLL